MGAMKHYRGQLRERSHGKVVASMLYQQVTLDEYLAMQYPPVLLRRYLEQATRDRDAERAQILDALQPGDTLWLWSRVESKRHETGGVAVKRGETVVHAWTVWNTSRDVES